MPRLRGLRVRGVRGAKDGFATQVTMRLKELFGSESSSKADKIRDKMIFQVRGVGAKQNKKMTRRKGSLTPTQTKIKYG